MPSDSPSTIRGHFTENITVTPSPSDPPRSGLRPHPALAYLYSIMLANLFISKKAFHATRTCSQRGWRQPMRRLRSQRGPNCGTRNAGVRCQTCTEWPSTLDHRHNCHYKAQPSHISLIEKRRWQKNLFRPSLRVPQRGFVEI